MPGFRAFSGALAAACAVALGACGGGDSGTIPADSGEALLSQLDQVERQIEEGDCDAANETAVAFAQNVSALPPSIGDELRKRLVEASANLEGLTQDPSQCEPDTGATGETGAVPTTTTTTTPPPATTTTTTTEPEPKEPPGQVKNGGNGNQPPGQGGGGQGGGGTGGDEGSGGVGSGG